MQKGRLKRFQTAFFLLLALQVIITACVDAGVAVAGIVLQTLAR
jgi:hypothetical protein